MCTQCVLVTLFVMCMNVQIFTDYWNTVTTLQHIFAYLFGLSNLSDTTVMVGAISLFTMAALRSNSPSTFEPLVRELTQLSLCSWKSDGSICRLGSPSETSKKSAISLDFTVFVALPNCLSNGDFPSFF